MDRKEFDENCKTPNPCPSAKTAELNDDAHLKKYITWENKSNICWLDASMALVAHNRVMKKYCPVSPDSRISKIISEYWEAMSVLNNTEKSFNHRLNLARGKLTFIQTSTLHYLQPILKYKMGDPESAFCSLYNLLIQDSALKAIFDVTWQTHKECSDCKDSAQSTKKKPVLTLSKIESFNPENPAVLYNCPCNKSLQKIKLSYVGLPPCLIFHFESGAGKECPPLSFTTQGREYQLTGIMTLEKSQDSTVNHFITWVRDPSVNKWLDCNDLNMDIISYSPDFPDIKFRDVYIYVYESFDEKGTITVSKIEHNISTKTNETIPCIDLSEESDFENCNSQRSNKDSENKEISTCNLKLQSNAMFVESGRVKSENSSSQNVSGSNKHIGKNETSAFKSELQDNTSVESDRDGSDNNCSQGNVVVSNIDTRKVEISVSDSQLQGNTSSIEPSRDKFENINFLNNVNKDVNKVEKISAIYSQLHDNVTSEVSDGNKSLEIGMSADNMQTFTSDRQKDFLRSLKTAASTSGTSYVKLSVRKKKSHSVPLHKKTSINEVNNPDSKESFSMSIYAPSCSKSTQETRVPKQEADEDYVPISGVSKRKYTRRISNVERGAINRKEGASNSKAKVEVLQTDLKRSQVRSKLKNLTNNKIPRMKKSSRITPKLKDITSKKEVHERSNIYSLNCSKEKDPEEHHQFVSEQYHSNSNTAAGTEKIPSDDEEGICVMEDYKDLWVGHDPDCHCDDASLEEEIDKVVDFTFAYICQLGHALSNKYH